MVDVIDITKPIFADVEVNRACNANCVYCPVSVTKKRKNEVMSLEEYENILQRLLQHEIAGITFNSYNEPLIDPLLKNRISLVRKLGIKNKLILFSNGILLNEDIINFVNDTDFLNITFNLPSIHEKEWEVLLGVDKRFHKKTLENIDNFIETQEYINFNISVHGESTTLTRRTQEIEQYYSPFKNVVVRQVFSHNRAGSINNDYVLQPNHNVKKTGGCDWWDKETRLFNHLLISYKSKILLCSHDFHQKHEIGDLKKHSIEEILLSEKSIDIRNQIYGKKTLDKNLICNNCFFLR